MIEFHSIILSATEVAAETAKPNLLGTLGINWKLFLAQLVNFAIVLFIFWKWVVKPLGSTLTKRQEKIEQGLHYAQQMEQEKLKYEEWKSSEMKKVRKEADDILRQTNDGANKLKQDAIVEAQSQTAKMLQQAKDKIDFEREQTLKEIRTEVATLVVAATEKILGSKIDSHKDQELIKDAIKQVHK